MKSIIKILLASVIILFIINFIMVCETVATEKLSQEKQVSLQCIDGIWRRVVNGSIDYNYTGLVENQYGLWYLENGKISFSYNGVYKNKDGEMYIIENSKCNPNAKGIWNVKDQWIYFENGKPNYNYTGIASNKHGEWLIEKGVISFGYKGTYWRGEKGYIIEGSKVRATVNKNTTEVMYINEVWRMVRNGVVDYNFNGLGSNKNGTWYLKNGMISFVYRGTYWSGEKGYIIEGSKVRTTVNRNTTEVMYINELWRMVKNGIVDYNYAGLGENKNGIWYIENGTISFKYNGVYENKNGQMYIIENSKFNPNAKGIWNVRDKWIYFQSGNPNYNYTGIASNKHGEWLIEKGIISFMYKGTYWSGEKGYIIEGSKVRANVNRNTTEVMYINELWRMVRNGVVDYKFNGLGENKNGKWLIENGKITFSYYGNYTDSLGNIYGLRGSKVETVIKNINHPGNMKIETPNPNDKYYVNGITISGWAVSKDINDKVIVYLDGKKIGNASRNYRNDVDVNQYGGMSSNPNIGFSNALNANLLTNGSHIIKIENITSDGKEIIQSREVEVLYQNTVEHEEGVYGHTGYGQALKYYKIGNGPNVFFATFAIHGYEDLWDKDGQELIYIANDLYGNLLYQEDIAKKWTVYIFPGVNLDGIKNGYTNNGPGRTTLYSDAPAHKGIDLNRCWQVGNSYTRYTDNRNYNGTEGFQAYEARYLRDFLLARKSTNGQNILVDLHGWTQQLIGNEQICSYYNRRFSENNGNSIGRYGTGYLINWARTYLGSKYCYAKSALIELPNYGDSIRSHQDVVNNRFSSRFIDCTVEMLREI